MTDVGGGWAEHVDPGSGAKYYAKAETGETSWEWPAELGAAPATGDWDERTDPGSGATYYFNRVTQETSWTPPPGYAGAAAPTEAEAAAATDPAKWMQKTDEASGKDFYYNSVTKETAWERPACLGAAPAPAPAPAAAEPAKEPAKTEAPTPEKEPSKPAAAAAPAPAPAPAAAPAVVEEPKGPTTAELVAKYADREFTKFAEAHFQMFRKGIFKAKTDIHKVTSWKNELMKLALLNFKDGELQAEALQMNRNILGFMGDRKSGKDQIDHAAKILTNMLQSPEELKNELYCQLIKQVTNNPSASSTVAGWKLLACALATFPPSEALAPHFGWVCAQNLQSELEDKGRRVAEYAEFCLHKLPVIVEIGTRRELPTIVEINATVRLEEPQVRVYFLDGRYLTQRVDAWCTARLFATRVAKTLGIENPQSFALFEVSSEDEERVLDPDERVLDVVAYWHRLETEAREKKGKKAEVEEYHFAYKVRHFFSVPDVDIAAVEMMYIQATHDIVDARYPCSEQDAVTLAALQIQEEYGDVPQPVESCPYLKGQLGKYLSTKVLEDGDIELREESLLKLYAKLAGYSPQEARLSYLDYVKSWKIYGSSYFFAEPKQNRDFPSEVVLAINAKGILVVDPESKEFLQEYPYTQVVTWGHSANSFVVVTGNAVNQKKVYFKTDQGKEMNVMVRAYVDHLAP